MNLYSYGSRLWPVDRIAWVRDVPASRLPPGRLLRCEEIGAGLAETRIDAEGLLELVDRFG